MLCIYEGPSMPLIFKKSLNMPIIKEKEYIYRFRELPKDPYSEAYG